LDELYVRVILSTLDLPDRLPNEFFGVNVSLFAVFQNPSNISDKIGLLERLNNRSFIVWELFVLLVPGRPRPLRLRLRRRRLLGRCDWLRDWGENRG
jgi:hypothetical protein